MRVLRGGGGERHRGHRSVIYAGDVGDAVEWRQIKRKTSCGVPAAFNQLETTTIACEREPSVAEWAETVLSLSAVLYFAI